jgi:glycerate 2-kinase
MAQYDIGESMSIARIGPFASVASDNDALLRLMFDIALASVSPEMCLPSRLPPTVAGKNYILAVGKAGASMARVAVEHFGSAKISGTILTRYGHAFDDWAPPECIRQIEAGHPLPDDQGYRATEQIMADIAALGPEDQLVALISGGGSALLAKPAEGVSIDDKRDITLQLLRSGASISEINSVRKHLSAVKGGRLAALAHPARIVTIAISDIPGDHIEQIASGPTVRDSSTLEQARHVIAKYRINCPDSIRTALNDPANETPDGRLPAFDQQIPPQICARASVALKAAGQIAQANGFTPYYLGDDLEGSATDLATIHAALALHYLSKGKKCVLLSSGETTVTVHNKDGQGGRNSEYLLALAINLGGHPAFHAIACDTDGIDGTEDNAGAIIRPSTLLRAREQALDARAILQSNRSYEFFRSLDDLIVTGPTRTNVNDFRAIMIDPSAV